MRRLPYAEIIFLALLNLYQSSYVSAWDNEVTHKNLSEFAAKLSILSTSRGDYLKKLGFNQGLEEVFVWGKKNQTVTKWLREGAFFEDTGSAMQGIAGTARYINHFHNPLPLKPWSQAGLDDRIVFHYTGQSALLWAQDRAKQSVWLGGDRTWQAIRDFFYTALTQTSVAERQAYFAQTFQGLGYQMHLIQDMSQPAHVRNDAHPADGAGWIEGLETWAKKHPDKIITNATNTITLVFPQVALNINIDGYLPISQFTDTNQYDGTNPNTSLTWGLSEYTNSNFLSDDTIFTENTATIDRHYFPYPRYSSDSYETYLVDYSSTKKRIYVRKKGDGEILEHFVTTGPLRKYLNFDPELQKKELKFDSAVHQDYSEKLIPRAVGYSAGLLNYFFRGSIEINLPSNGIYSSATGTSAGFTRITLAARNTTSTGEDMNAGSLQLVVRYKLAHADPFQSLPVETDDEFSYTVVSEANNVSAIPKNSPVELTFDLSNNPLPFWATDIYLQVVYHGRLGSEDGAVAVGFKDISEPTPVDLYNNMDRICLNGNWYIAEGSDAINQAPLGWDIYAHNIQDGYLKIASESDAAYASPSSYTFSLGTIPPGALYRAYVLSDYNYPFNYSDYAPAMATTSADTADHAKAILTGHIVGSAIKNQVDYQVMDQAACDEIGGVAPCDILTYPLLSPFRGTMMWGPAGFIIDNPKYPSDTNCPREMVQ